MNFSHRPRDPVVAGDKYLVSSGAVNLAPNNGRLPLLRISNGSTYNLWVRPTHAGGGSTQAQYDVLLNPTIVGTSPLTPLTLLNARAGDPLSSRAALIQAQRGTPGAHIVPITPAFVVVVLTNTAIANLIPSSLLLAPGRTICVVASIVGSGGTQTVSVSAEMWF